MGRCTLAEQDERHEGASSSLVAPVLPRTRVYPNLILSARPAADLSPLDTRPFSPRTPRFRPCIPSTPHTHTHICEHKHAHHPVSSQPFRPPVRSTR